MKPIFLSTKIYTAFFLLLVLSTNLHSGSTKSNHEPYPDKSYRVHLPSRCAATLKKTLRTFVTTICPVRAEQDDIVSPDNHQEKDSKYSTKNNHTSNQGTESGNKFIHFPDGSEYRKVLDLKIENNLRLAIYKKSPVQKPK